MKNIYKLVAEYLEGMLRQIAWDRKHSKNRDKYAIETENNFEKSIKAVLGKLERNK